MIHCSLIEKDGYQNYLHFVRRDLKGYLRYAFGGIINEEFAVMIFVYEDFR